MERLKQLLGIFRKAALALLGALSVVAIIPSAVLIWIGLFDDEGGEPGSVTIFWAMTLWPAFLIAIIAVAIGSAKRPCIAGIAAIIACNLVLGAWLTP